MPGFWVSGLMVYSGCVMIANVKILLISYTSSILLWISIIIGFVMYQASILLLNIFPS